MSAANNQNPNHCNLVNKFPLNICQFNVNGIKSTTKFTKSCDIIQRLNPHVMAMIETKIDDTIFPRFPNYKTAARVDRDARGGGVMILVKDNIKFHSTTNLSIGSKVQLCSIIIKELQIIVIYKAPKTAATEERKLMKTISKMAAKHLNTIVLGDVNLPNIEPTWQTSGLNHMRAIDNEWVHMMQTLNMTQQVRSPTHKGSTLLRQGHTVGNTLDLVFTSSQILLQSCDVLPSEADPVFDHFPVMIGVKTSPNAPPRKVTKYIENDATWEEFKYKMHNHQVNEMLTNQPTTTDQLEQVCTDLAESIITSYRSSTPTKTHTVNNSLPWMTKTVKKALNSARTLNRNAKKETDPIKRRSMYARLKQRRIYNNFLIRQAHRNHQGKSVDNPNASSRDFFKMIDGFKRPPMPVGPIMNSGKLVTDEEEMATIFNRFLTGFFGNKAKLKSGWNNYRNTWVPPTTADVIAKIKNLKVKSAPGNDGVTTTMLKKCMGTVAPLIAMIVKKCKELSYFPRVFKMSKIKLLYKKGDVQDLENYRPIALTSILGKLIESFITDQLIKQLEEGGILDLAQHGFRAKSGCHTALVTMWQDVTNNFEKMGGCTLVALDLTKAFDKANHQVLVDELADCNVEYQLGEVLKSWLKDRQQLVDIEGHQSPALPVNGSVVQGSRLGPVLWLVYVNSLLKELRKSGQKFTAFADDIVLHSPINSAKAQEKMQRSLKVIEKWSQSHSMTISNSKSNVMKVGRQMDPYLAINDKVLPVVTSMVILGVTFSSDGRFQRMADRQAQAINYKTAVLRRNLKVRSTRVMTTLYNAYIRSRAFYCSEAWHQKDAGVADSLKKAIKNFWSLSNVGRPPNVLTVEEEFFVKDVCLLKKIQWGATILREIDLQMTESDRRPENSALIPRPLAVRFIRKNEFTIRSSYYWEWLKPDIRLTPSTDSFPGKVRKMVIQARHASDTQHMLPVLP